MTSMDDYFGRVQAIAWEATDYVSATSLQEVQRLIDHGEPAEGLCSLAWAIVTEDARVPSRLLEDIRAHTAELIDDEFMPPRLSDFAIEASPGEVS